MKILIDADGCPVVDETVCLARKKGIACLILCDTSHVFEKKGARTIMVSKGTDSVDFALVNLIEKGDIVITQDFGLAAMCLARDAVVLNQNGMQYTCLLYTSGPTGGSHPGRPDRKNNRAARRDKPIVNRYAPSDGVPPAEVPHGRK